MVALWEMRKLQRFVRTASLVGVMVGGAYSASVPTSGAPRTLEGAPETLTRADFLQRVVESNRAIQSRLAAFQAARSLYKAEGGQYEPTLVTSTEWIDRQRPNTIELERSLRSGGEFIERNWHYNAGIETRTPTGGKVRFGGQMRELRNNVQRTVIAELEAEYETSAGVVLEQPLLKNAGLGVSSAARRLAARSAEVSYQDFRRQLMLTIAQAEISYWELFLAQEAVGLSNESVQTADSLLTDNQSRFESGRGARLDVLEAEAGRALRRSRQSVAQQRRVEAMNRFAAFFAAAPAAQGRSFRAGDAPELRTIVMEYQERASTALAMSPDVLRAHRQLEQEKIRLGVARNQRLPQVDLRGSFGSAGLGYNWSTAWRDSEKATFPQWAVALEMRVPLLAGVRERNEVKAAQHRVLQAELTADDAEIQVRANLEAAMRRVESTSLTARSNAEAVAFRRTLLSDRLTAREAGRRDTRAVLEVEDELVSTRLEHLDSEVEHQRAVLELQVLDGTLLQNRSLEISISELESASREWARQQGGALRFLKHQERPKGDASPAPSGTADGRLEPDRRSWWSLRKASREDAK
jgi:outer membrane protein